MLPILQILSDLASSLKSWLAIREVRARWELSRDIAQHYDEYEDAITDFRNSSDHERADLLLRRMARDEGFANPVRQLLDSKSGPIVHGDAAGNVGISPKV